MPLGLAVEGASRHDLKLMRAVLERTRGDHTTTALRQRRLEQRLSDAGGRLQGA